MLKQASSLVMFRGDSSCAGSSSNSISLKCPPIIVGMLAPKMSVKDSSSPSKSTGCKAIPLKREESICTATKRGYESSPRSSNEPVDPKGFDKRKLLNHSDSMMTVSTSALSDSSSSNISRSSRESDDYPDVSKKATMSKNDEKKKSIVNNLKASAASIASSVRQKGWKKSVKAAELSQTCNVVESDKENIANASEPQASPSTLSSSRHVKDGCQGVVPKVATARPACNVTKLKTNNVAIVPTNADTASCASCAFKHRRMEEQAQEIEHLHCLIYSMVGLLSQQDQDIIQLKGLTNNPVGLLSQLQQRGNAQEQEIDDLEEQLDHVLSHSTESYYNELEVPSCSPNHFCDDSLLVDEPMYHPDVCSC